MKKLLIVVDYQVDFVTGSLGFEKAISLEDGIYNKVKEYLENKDNVVFTYDTHLEDYLSTREGKYLPVEHCIKGTDGHKLYGKLREFENNKNIHHVTKYSFGLSPVEVVKLYKEIGNVDEIEVVGIVTDICVISNVVMFQAQYINAEIIVNKNLCASFDEDKHNKALDILGSLQVQVVE